MTSHLDTASDLDQHPDDQIRSSSSSSRICGGSDDPVSRSTPSLMRRARCLRTWLPMLTADGSVAKSARRMTKNTSRLDVDEHPITRLKPTRPKASVIGKRAAMSFQIGRSLARDRSARSRWSVDWPRSEGGYRLEPFAQ